jgi:predicted Rossmann-fold nucleotide-binding protein
MVVCIFGASGAEIDKIYIEQTEILGEKLAKRGHSLMFGGGKFGLMGAAARGFRKGGGHITGVIPTFFGDYDVIYDCD